MRSRSVFPILTLLAAAPLLAQPPETIVPGDPRVDGSFIHNVTNAWRMTGTSPGGQRTDGGIWKDKIEIVGSVIKRTQVDAGPGGTTTFITETDQRTMAPIRAELTTPSGLHRVLTFEKDHVHSVITAGGKTRETDLPLSQPIFDFNGGLFGLLVDSFPLRENFTAKFPIFDPRGGIAWASYTVIGRESVPAGNGKRVDAWTVEVQDPVRVARMIFSLTKEPPYIIRLEEAGEGKFWVFDMM
ncbi:MAG TPA: hypothetical protein VJ853_06150 [Thermoanaerobaculia bacterium]|nr:hypothetical protein [Thermoanaerobaculia bacterium]